MDMKPLSITQLETLGFKVWTKKKKGNPTFDSCSMAHNEDWYLYFTKQPTFHDIIDFIIKQTRDNLYNEVRGEVKSDFLTKLINLID